MTKESCYSIVTVNDITAKVMNQFLGDRIISFNQNYSWTLMMTDDHFVKRTVTSNDNSGTVTRLCCKN